MYVWVSASDVYIFTRLKNGNELYIHVAGKKIENGIRCVQDSFITLRNGDARFRLEIVGRKYICGSVKHVEFHFKKKEG